MKVDGYSEEIKLWGGVKPSLLKKSKCLPSVCKRNRYSKAKIEILPFGAADIVTASTTEFYVNDEEQDDPFDQ